MRARIVYRKLMLEVLIKENIQNILNERIEYKKKHIKHKEHTLMLIACIHHIQNIYGIQEYSIVISMYINTYTE